MNSEDLKSEGVLSQIVQKIADLEEFVRKHNAALQATGSNTGDVTLAVVGAVPNIYGASLSSQVLTLQPADATRPGAVTELAQSFGGDKTFTGNIVALNLLSGTYTPVLTNTTNVAASVAYPCQWVRVGNTVAVSGRLDVDATAAGAQTLLGISLPVASNFANIYELGGSAVAPGIISECAAIIPDTANDRATMSWITTTANYHGMSFFFMYQII